MINSVQIAQIRTRPLKPPTTPTRNIATSYTQLVVDYSALIDTDTGGSPVVSYGLRYDDGSSGTIWTNLVGYVSDNLALTYSVTTSI